METYYPTSPSLVKKFYLINPNLFISRLPFILVVIILIVFQVGQTYGQQKTLGMTKHKNGSTETGYVLFAPLLSKTTYLIDKCGKKVHSWTSNYSPGLSVYLLPDGNLLRTGVSQDTFFASGGKGGIIEKMDWNGNTIWACTISNDSLVQHHDVHPLDNGNILVIAWHKIPEAKALSKGRIKGSFTGPNLYSERIMEIKPTGKNGFQVVWQWSLWDHLVQDETFSKPDFNVVSNNPQLMNINFASDQSPDWIHINAIDYNKDLDQIMLTCHNTSEIWIIDHSTTIKEATVHAGGTYGRGGDILYRWGNASAYNKGTSLTQKLFYPHYGHWIPKNYNDGGDIMIFNNGLGRSPAFSSVDIITPPQVSKGVYSTTLPYAPTSVKWRYRDSVPEKFYSPVYSGASRLPNGNTLICSGLPGKLFEIDNSNTTVWEYINPVAPNDRILKDGESAGNSVFRSIYYPENYNGFIGKSLTPGSTIELNSYTYSCSLNPPSYSDSISPYPITFNPIHNSKNLATNPLIFISFNELIDKGNVGYLNIYENNKFKEAISASDSRITISNNSMIVNLIDNFNYSSRVSISFEEGFITDTTGNLVNALDSSDWAFNTTIQTSINELNAAKLKGSYPNPVKNYLTVPYENSTPKVQLINNLGQKLTTKVSVKNTRELIVEMENLYPGIYILMLNGQFSETIIKQ